MNDAGYLLLGLGALELLGILGLGYATFVLDAVDVMTMALGVFVLAAITLPGYVWAVRNGAF